MAKLEKDSLDEHIENFHYATSLIKIILGITAVIIFLFSRHGFIFFSAAILPSILVIFADKAAHKCASATICTFNFIGASPYLKHLWKAHSLDETAKDLISDPLAWFMIYTTSFFGLLIYLALPNIIAQIYVAKANLRVGNLIDHRNKICSEWDIKLNKTRNEDEEFSDAK